MDTNKYKSEVADTINNLLTNDKEHKHETPASKEMKAVDMGGFLSDLKKEIMNLKIPIYNIKVSDYRHQVVVLELPFCKSCEISVDHIEFGEEKLQATLFIDKKPVRKIKLESTDSKYMTKVAIALIDYFKRYMLLKNKFDS